MTTKRRAGGSAIASLLLIGWLGSHATASAAAPGPQSYALIAGTVFRDSGLSLAGAQLVLEPAGDSARNRKLKKMQALSDARGEFAFRVPPEPADYRLVVQAPGYQRAEKQVRVSGEERIDVFFRLQPASNNK